MKSTFIFVAVLLLSFMGCSCGDSEIGSALVPGIDIAEKEREQILEAVLSQYTEIRPDVVLLLDSRRIDEGSILIDARERYSVSVFPFVWPFRRFKYGDGQLRIVSDWKSRDDTVTVVVAHFGLHADKTHTFSLQRDSSDWVLVWGNTDWLMLTEITGCFENE